MIIDILENLGMYGVTEEKYVQAVTAFIRQASKEKKEQGKYEVLDEIFALVQDYRTKETSKFVMEAHRKYIDLQYLISGEEYFYIHNTGECTLVKDETPEQDFLFLNCNEPDVKVKVKAGMFVMLFPQDAHLPCVSTAGSTPVEKLVFKIPMEYMKR